MHDVPSPVDGGPAASIAASGIAATGTAASGAEPTADPAGRAALPGWLLPAVLSAYVVTAVLVAWFQRGYYNSDFVAYVGIAHLLATDPAASVSGYWSPLFSWLMAPLLQLGVGDLTAGRLVLLAAGAGYVVAVHGLACNFAPRDRRGAVAVVAPVLVCAAIQAALWATHLLDPDLLGNTFLFTCLALATGGANGVRRGLAVGACAGLAYLGKAFMLPVLMLFLPVAVWLAPRLRPHQEHARTTGWLRSLLPVGIGLVLVAGPWIAVLSQHYGYFTFSTAGPANHANIGPAGGGQDPLWNPPLQAGYIFDPHYGPDWSPLQSWQHLAHQLRRIGYNLARSAGHLGGWIAMFVLAALARRRHRAAVPALHRPRMAFVLVAATIYVGGYALIDVERRYLLPTLAPLLCLGAMQMAAPLVAARRGTVRWSLLLPLLFGAQELRLLVITAARHPQSAALASHQRIAEAMAQAGVGSLPFAASRWHHGLGVAYAGNAIPRYFGRPLATTEAARAAELAAAGVRCYLNLLDVDAAGETQRPALPAPWRRVLAARPPAGDAEPEADRFELFVRD